MSSGYKHGSQVFNYTFTVQKFISLFIQLLLLNTEVSFIQFPVLALLVSHLKQIAVCNSLHFLQWIYWEDYIRFNHDSIFRVIVSEIS